MKVHNCFRGFEIVFPRISKKVCFAIGSANQWTSKQIAPRYLSWHWTKTTWSRCHVGSWDCVESEPWFLWGELLSWLLPIKSCLGILDAHWQQPHPLSVSATQYQDSWNLAVFQQRLMQPWPENPDPSYRTTVTPRFQGLQIRWQLDTRHPRHPKDSTWNM